MTTPESLLAEARWWAVAAQQAALALDTQTDPPDPGATLLRWARIGQAVERLEAEAERQGCTWNLGSTEHGDYCADLLLGSWVRADTIPEVIDFCIRHTHEHAAALGDEA